MLTTTLILANGQKILSPSENDINSALQNLSNTGYNKLLMINHDDEMTFLQAHGDPYNGFSLEYQEGSLKEHYNSIDENLGFNFVLNIFQRYSNNDIEWKNSLEWKKKIGTRIKSSINKEKIIVLSLIIILIMFTLAVDLSDNPFAKK